MREYIDHYAHERNITALKVALEKFETHPRDVLDQLRFLADCGSPMSMIYIGIAYRNGHGITKDPKQAEKWFRQAADFGSILGLYELGRLYLTQKKFEDAHQTLRFAAAAGYAPAIYLMGRLYIFGQGVEMDIPKGMSLLEEASAWGHILATRHLGHALIRYGKGPVEYFRGLILTIRSFFEIFWVAFREGLGSDRIR